MSKLSLLERETIFLMNEKEKTATVFTYNRAYQKKLKNLCNRCSDNVILQSKNDDGAFIYCFPKNWLKIYPPRQVSEKRKQTLEAMRKKRRLKKYKQ